MTTTTTEDCNAFLARRTRFAMLSSLRADGSPITVPVWFEWDGSELSMFCAVNSIKLVRLGRDPRVSVLVANDVDEPEFWVSFSGEVRIDTGGGFELAERLAPRYWDLDDEERSATLEVWRSFAEVGFRKITLIPTKILEYQPDQPPEEESS